VLLLLRLAVDDGVVAAFDSIVMLVGIVGISLAEAEMEDDDGDDGFLSEL